MVDAAKGFAVMSILVAFSIVAVSPFIAKAETVDYNSIRADLNNSDWQIRRGAIDKLCTVRSEESFQLLLETARNKIEYWPITIKAVTCIGETGDPRAIEVILGIFNNAFANWECPSIKSYAAAALGNFKGDTRVVNTLISGINDGELLTREASINALGRIGDTRAVPALLAALNEKNIAVKLSAINALGKIKDLRAMAPLRALAENDSDPFIRQQAVSAMRSISPDCC